MSNQKYTLSHAKLRGILEYNPISGVFIRTKNTRGARAGDVAGGVEKDGYVRIGIHKYHYPAHTLAWFYHYGMWPGKHIDHIDGNRANNAINNLRLANQSENTQNLKKARSTSKTGLLGVCVTPTGYIATITVKGVSHYLGAFKDPKEAHLAYLKAKKELHPFSTIHVG